MVTSRGELPERRPHVGFWMVMRSFVARALAVQGFVGQKEDFEWNPVVDWEPVELGKYTG